MTNKYKFEICQQCGHVRWYEANIHAAGNCFICDGTFVEVKNVPPHISIGIERRYIGTPADESIRNIYKGPPFNSWAVLLRNRNKIEPLSLRNFTRNQLRDRVALCKTCAWVGTAFSNQTTCPICYSPLIETDCKPLVYLRVLDFERGDLEQELRGRYMESTNHEMLQYRLRILNQMKKHGQDIYSLTTQCPDCKSVCDKKMKIHYGLFKMRTRYQWHCNNCGANFD